MVGTLKLGSGALKLRSGALGIATAGFSISSYFPWNITLVIFAIYTHLETISLKPRPPSKDERG